MNKRKSVLDQIQIPKSCPVNWDAMIGDERTRFCAECNRHVYNLSEMTARQAEAIVAASYGQLCARVTRLPDGTIWSRPEMVIIQPVTRRPPAIAAAVVSAMMTISSTGASLPPGRATTGQPFQSQISPGQPGVVRSSANAGPTMQDAQPPNAEPVTPGSLEPLILQSLGSQIVEIPSHNLNLVTLQSGMVASRELPLRELCEKSDRIVVGEVGPSSVSEISGSQKLMRTALLVSNTLKGKHQRVVYVYHWVHVASVGKFEPGSALLVFLNQREHLTRIMKTPGFELADLRRGVKKLPQSALQTYQDRIRELVAIHSTGEPQVDQIVEWLVRCAEDPATRWEGAHELATSVESCAAPPQSSEDTDDEEETGGDEEPPDELNASEQPTSEDDQGEDDEEEVAEPQDEEPAGLDLAARLTAEQKDRLMSALINTKDFSEGTVELIEVVKSWKDPRLLPFLIDTLRRHQENPPQFAEDMVNAVADLVGFGSVRVLATIYCDEVTYDDLEEEDEPDLDERGQVEVQAGEEEIKYPPLSVGNEKEEPEDRAERARAARAELLKRFLDAVERRINHNKAIVL